jgi:hypothetical protein
MKPTVMAVLIIAGITALALLSKSITNPKQSKHVRKVLRKMIRNASTWNTIAQQDQNPLIAITHSNYALAFARTARMLASDSAIEKTTGINIGELVSFLEDSQQKLMQKMFTACPSIKPSGMFQVQKMY